MRLGLSRDEERVRVNRPGLWRFAVMVCVGGYGAREPVVGCRHGKVLTIPAEHARFLW